ncbi:MAG: helix-turn-helix domain-containing protein [Fibrobacteria bacterium]
MSEETIGAPEGREHKPANGNEGGAAGRALKEARQMANIDANKLCSDLRISPQALEALEQGNYHLLPGDPYIRALLGSIGRYLNLDPQVLVQLYNKEIGAVATAPSIAPYKDRTQTHTAAHKQIFFVIFAVLFIVLFLLFRKLNVEDGNASKVLPSPATAATDTPSPAAPDSLLESKSLAPDTALAKASPDSGETRGSNPPRPAVPARPAAAPTPGLPVEPTVIDSSHLTLALVKPLVDSVGVKVMRSGKEDFATMLRLGKQMQVSHTDTIVVAISKGKSVEVTLGGKTVIPERKRFKIYGTTLKTF